MGNFDDKIRALRYFVDTNLNATIRDTVEDNEFEIAQMNANEQLYGLGIDRNGIDIYEQIPYAQFTIEIKTAKNQPTDRVTLRDTGDFHRNFYVSANETSFEISSTDEKTEDILRKYGDSIFGLTDENLNELIHDKIKPEIIYALKRDIRI